MQLRPFGRTGLVISPITFGAMNLGGGTDAATSETMLLTALDAGVTMIDTADIYHRGESERIVGSVLARSGRRDEVLIATKCGMPAGPGPNDRGASRRHIVASCERSLRRLGTDRIDLYQLHRAFLDTAPEETLAAFDQLVTAGKVVDIGSSTHPAWFLATCLDVSDRHGWPAYISEQTPYNLLDRRAENELIPLLQRRGIALLPWSPIGAGILAGRYRGARGTADPRGPATGEGTAGGPPPPDSRAAIHPPLLARVTPQALTVADAVAGLATSAGLTPAQLALLWLRDAPGVTSPIVGPRTPEQLAEYLAAGAHPPLDADLRTALDALVPPGGHVSDFYNTSGWMSGVARRPAEEHGAGR